MDFVTHSLLGAGAARLLTPRPEWLPQLSLAAVLGSLLIDADPWLYLIDPAYYGRYHRVVTHCAIGLVGMAFLCAAIARLLMRVSAWRRFGWFVSDSLKPGAGLPEQAPFRWLLAAALCATVLHFLGDVITGFGNMLPLWPFSNWDASLAAVESFDWVIFSMTLGWHVFLRNGNPSRGREWTASTCYLLAVAIYVILRWQFGPTTVW